MRSLTIYILLIIGIGLLLFFWAYQTDETKLKKAIESFEDYTSYNPDLPLSDRSLERFDKDNIFYSNLYASLEKIDSAKLEESDQISLELLKFVVNESLVQYKFKQHLNPILSDAGFHISLTFKVQELTNQDDVTEYLKILEAIPNYVEQSKDLIRKGLEAGVSQPLVIFKGYESSYEQHITDSAQENYYFSPLTKLPDNLPIKFRDSVQEVGVKLIEEKVIPSFQSIKEFFESEYYPNTRTTIGVSSIPDGLAYYQSRIYYYTTLDYTAEEIYEIGLKEVERIRNEMLSIIDSIEFEGSFEDFLSFLRSDSQFYAESPNELLMLARDVSKRLDEQLPRYFQTLPRKPYGVKKVPDAIAPKYTGGRYVSTDVNSTEPGYYLVNTYNLLSRPLYVIPSLTAHEAVPGHHLQYALTKELSIETPHFRRNLYLSAYGEGWGLYSEYLADEMGIYISPYEKFGQLTYEMWRACRLVVDTGIHAFDWTRDRAVNFLSNNTALSIHEVNTEIDRYISWPGQALSYKIGEITIRDLRKEAETTLGTNFDIREFHEIVLEQGVVTLPILKQRVEKYIQDAID